MIQVIRETHQALPPVQEELRAAGGLNRFGEPNYRAAWGGSRLAWIGGKWEDRDAEGNLIRETVEVRLEPKYAPQNRWHIERWVPPEAYGSPQQWREQTIEIANGRTIPALGPYPSRGEYEHCFTLEGSRGEFIQLTPAVARHIARAIEFGRGVPPHRRREALADRALREEHAYDAFADAVLSDAAPAFHGVPQVAVPAGGR